MQLKRFRIAEPLLASPLLAEAVLKQGSSGVERAKARLVPDEPCFSAIADKYASYR
jgi:hypothetical protein